MKTMRRLRRGSSLMEVLLTIYLITFLVLSMLGVVGSSQRMGQESEARAIALAVAKQQMEALRGIGETYRIPTTGTEFPISEDIQAQFAKYAGQNRMSGTYSIESDAGSTTLQRLTVRVTWHRFQEKSTGASSEVALSSLIMVRDSAAWSGYGTTISDLLVPPPPPPPPTPPTPPTPPVPAPQPSPEPIVVPAPEPAPQPAPDPAPTPAPDPEPVVTAPPVSTGFVFDLYGSKWSYQN